MEGPAYLCKTDEVGEICVGSASGGSYYWGLKGMSNSTFRVQPLLTSGDPMGETEFIRSGLLGFLGPVCSSSIHSTLTIYNLFIYYDLVITIN